MNWEQGQQIELVIDNLSDDGNGVGRYQERVVFVPNTVPGDRVLAKVIQLKPKFATARLEMVLAASEHRIRPQCIVADKCGGCQWQAVSHDYQLQSKQNQVIQALQRIGGFQDVPISPILPAPAAFGYRNKVTYPLGLSTTGQVQAGYYRQGSHRLVNINQCPIQDAQLDPLLAAVKQDIQHQGWSIYDEDNHTGTLRHLCLRVGRRTGEILLTLVVKGQEVTKTPEKVPLGVENTERSPHLLLKKRRKTVPASATKIIDSGSHRHSKTVVTDAADLSGLEAQAQRWLEQYPQLVGVCLNFNAHPGNVVFGQETFCVAGRGYLQEEFAGLTLRLNPETFFQVNTEAAEALLREIQGELNLQGHEILVDAYCGIGTLSLPLAQQVQQVIGLEVQASAIAQAQQNSEFNQIKNISFQAGTVETLLPNLDVKPDIVVLDPPRKGCDPRVIEALIELQSQKLVYMSCKPATLARDLKLLCESGIYRLTRIQPADFFPQTSHVECAAFLVKN